MLEIRKLNTLEELRLLTPSLLTLDQYYPNIDNWYRNKVLSDPANESNLAIGAFVGGTLAGFVLAKNGDEKKLRCVRVSPSHQNTGLGLRLLERGMELLETSAPLVTVSEELLGQYSRIFVNRYGYSLDEVVKGAYRRGKLEYVFNGSLQ